MHKVKNLHWIISSILYQWALLTSYQFLSPQIKVSFQRVSLEGVLKSSEKETRCRLQWKQKEQQRSSNSPSLLQLTITASVRFSVCEETEMAASSAHVWKVWREEASRDIQPSNIHSWRGFITIHVFLNYSFLHLFLSCPIVSTLGCQGFNHAGRAAWSQFIFLLVDSINLHRSSKKMLPIWAELALKNYVFKFFFSIKVIWWSLSVNPHAHYNQEVLTANSANF